eukprot:scaffold2629_cov152-Amphora_coffeaeformis.AAC.11
MRVAVLGPPNAGKSTLFNRLMDKQENKTYKLHAENGRKRKKKGRLAGASSSTLRGGTALVSPVPGTTRDRREAVARLGDLTFLLIDTAGVDGLRLESWYKGRLEKRTADHDDADNDYQRPMMEQAVMAAQQASLIFFMFDGRVGLSSDDLETCRWLRRHVLSPNTGNNNHHKNNSSSGAPPQRVVLLANKLEGTILEDNSLYEEFLEEASRAGFGPAIPISALQGDGIADLAVALMEMQQTLGLGMTGDNDDKSKQKNEKENPMQMAILGRPNVGKSTLVNALLQEHRVITGSRPGLTRDAIRIPWTWQGQQVQIVDTAGIRKASQRQDPHASALTGRKKSDPDLLEDMAVTDALRALRVADVAVLIIDADERTLSRQDLAIANAILEEGRVLVVVANKMDLVIDEENPEDPYTRHDLEKGVRQQLEERFPFLRHTPIIPLDSKSGKNVANDLMPTVMKAKERWERTISTGMLNRWLAEVVDGQAPPMVNGRPTKLKYILQTKGRPPTFLIYTNTDSLPERYVRLAIKKSTSSEGGNPYVPSGNKRGGTGLGGREARHDRRMKNLKETGSRRLARRKRKGSSFLFQSWLLLALLRAPFRKGTKKMLTPLDKPITADTAK